MSTLAPSSLKSSPNKLALNNRTVGLMVGIVSVLILGFAVFQIYGIFQESLDVKPVENATHANFFDKQTIEDMRYINQHKSDTSIPEGRINPYR